VDHWITGSRGRGHAVDDVIYRVVKNHEEQYSIWPEAQEMPLGWTDSGKTGAKAECLDHIDQVWTDMRPLSARGD
jgi:MbtH protein